MQVFKVYLKILWKRKGSILLYMGIFLTLSFVLSSFGEEERTGIFEAEKYPVAVFDHDRSEASRMFADYIKSKSEVAEYEEDPEILTDHLFTRNISCVIYIRKGFGEELEKGNTEHLIEVTTLPGTVYSQSVLNYVNQYLGTVYAYQKTGFTLMEAMSRAGELLQLKVKVRFGGQQLKNEKSDVYYFMLYLPYILISCGILGISSCIVAFNRRELRDRMNVSAYPLSKRNVGLWGGCVLVQAGYTFLFLVLAEVIYRNGAFDGTRGLMLLNLLCFSLLALSLSFLVGMLIDKEQALDMASTVLGLALAFLGGIFVPLEVMGDSIKLVSHFIPTYWYVTALEVVERGAYSSNGGEYWLALGMQLAFAAAFLALGMAVSKIRRRAA